MPDPELYCEVRSASGVYRDWTSVTVSYTYEETEPLRHVSLTCAEPSATGALRLKPGDRIDVALGGQVVIQEGYVKIRQVAFDANRHGVQVVGLSKAGAIQDASVNVKGGQFRGYDFKGIANAILKPYGMRFRYENPPKGATMPFPNVMVRLGETNWHMLTRLARDRGLNLRIDPNGDVIGGCPDGGSGAILEEGRNILSCNSYLEFPWVDSIVGHSQMPGSDSLFGRGAAEISSTAKLPGGDQGRVLKTMKERPLNQQELQTSVNMDAADILRATLQVTIVHHGWFKPGSSDLWQLGEHVTVKSPMAFPTSDGKAKDLRVWSVTCSQTAEAGTLTTLQLVSEAVFTRKYEDGNADDPYRQSATEAGPTAET